MQESASSLGPQVEKEVLSWPDFFLEVARGVLVAAGLLLLWVMESARNRFFRLLDRLKVRARPKSKASAFPPGPVPKLKQP